MAKRGIPTRVSEFAPEYTGSYLIALQKPSGGIRGIAPVDIWKRGRLFVV